MSVATTGSTHVVADETQLEVAGFPRYIDVFNRPSDFSSFATHLIQFDHRTFTSANIARVQVTNDLVNSFQSAISGTALGKKLTNFAWTKSPLKAKIVVQGQPFAAGKIICSFMPQVKAAREFVESAAVLLCPTVNSMIVPHLEIDPSKTETYEIELPVCTPYGVWDWDSNEVFGSYQVQYTFITPILSGTAVAPSITCCMYVGLAVPTMEGLTLLSNDFQAEKEPGVVSSFFHTVGKYAPLLSVPFPSLAPGITLFSSVSSSVGNFLSYLGYSKPPQLDTQLFPTTRNVDNWSQFDGTSNALVLAGSQTTSLGLSAQYGGGTDDEMLLANLCAKEGIIRQDPITTAMTNGSLIARFYVYPSVYNNSDAKSTLTPLAGVALPFSAWVGDIDYVFEVVASVFHRATILVAWDAQPVIGAAAPTLSAVMQTLPNTVITVAGNSRTKITIPWAQPNTWGRVRNPTNGAFAIGHSDMVNGEIYIFLVNPLTSNGSTDSIKVNTYISSKNIRFAVPSNIPLGGFVFDPSAVPLGLVADPIEEEVLDTQGLTTLSSPFCAEATVSFGPPTDTSNVFRRCFGEDYHSVKQVTSRLSSAYSDTITVPSTITRPYYRKTVINKPFVVTATEIEPVATDRTQTYFAWFYVAFLGYRGGVRHVFHPHSVDATYQGIRPHMWVGHTRSSDPTATNALANTDVYTIRDVMTMNSFTSGIRSLCPTMDCVAPLFTRADFIPRGVYSSDCDYLNFVFSIDKPATNVDLRLEHLQASADDGTFVWFLGWPPSDVVFT